MDTERKKKRECPDPGSEDEVTSNVVEMGEQEADIICKMHRLVGDRWALIAGRIPGRNEAEIEKFWINRRLATNTPQENGKKKRLATSQFLSGPEVHVDADNP